MALYYGGSQTGYAGNLIVEGLRQAAGTNSGSYVWDVTDMPAGAYFVYAMLFDGNSTGRAYAPGAVVIQNANPAGTLNMTGVPATFTEGTAQAFTVSYGNTGGKALWFPLVGDPFLPGQTTFSAAPAKTGNTQVFNLVTPYQCNTQHKDFPLQLGPIQSEDPNFSSRVVRATPKLAYAASNTGDESLRVCDVRIVSERAIDATHAEYKVAFTLSNLGAAISSATVAPVAQDASLSASGMLQFHAIGPGDTARGQGEVTVLGAPGSGSNGSILLKGLSWSVQVIR